MDSVSPLVKVNNEYISLIVKSWFDTAISAEKDKVYKIVFPKGCSKKLMLLQSGELSGLRTTSVVEDGKIQATAGLEEVFERNEYKLLSFALFGLVEQHLNHLSDISQELYQLKQIEIKAKFERVSYVLKSTFDILPELLVDKSLRAAYLSQIVESNSHCFELYVILRESFKSRCKEIEQKLRHDKSSYHSDNRCSHLSNLLNDNVFAALERFAYGKICEIFLSNNFTDSYLDSIQKQLRSMTKEIENIMYEATPHEKTFKDQWQLNIEELDLSEREPEKSRLNNYIARYEGIFQELSTRLNTNIQGVDAIAKHSKDNDIQLFIKEGEIYMHE